MISRQFLKSSVIYSTVGALPSAAGFILIPWFTALLTPAQFGINALYITLMYLSQIICSFGLDMSTGVLYFDFKDNKQKLNEFMGTVFLMLSITGTLTLLFFVFGGIELFRITFKSQDFIELIPFGLLTILSGVFNSFFKTYSALLINQQRPERFFWINVINFILTIGPTLILLYIFPFNLYGPVVGRLIPAVIMAAITLTLIGREYGLTWHSIYLKKIISYTAPLLVNGLMTWVVSYIDRFLILRIMKDPVSVAIFDVSWKLVMGIELIMAWLVNTITPKVYNIWKDQQVRGSTLEVNRYYNGLTAFFLLFLPLFTITVPIVLPLVIKEEVYYRAFDFLPVMAAAYATRVWFFLFLAPVMYFKNTKALPKVLLISAVFEVICGSLMILYFGLWGAVITNFLIKPLQALMLWFFSKKTFEFRLNAWKIFYLPLIFVSLSLLCEGFLAKEYRFGGLLFQFVVNGLLVFTVYRREIPLLLRRRS